MSKDVTFTVRYSDFWPGFDPSNCLFTHVLRRVTGKPITVVKNPEVMVDLQIDSSFIFSDLKSKTFARAKGMTSRRSYLEYVAKSEFGYRPGIANRSLKSLWYTGENIRLPSREYDGYLSFEKSDALINNLYLPYWFLRMNFGYPNPEYEITPSPAVLSNKRKAIKREYSTCTFTSTGNPARLRLIDLVNKKMSVDSFGDYFNKKVASKLEVSSRYGFQICTENDLYPGYVTEKLQEAWTARNVPIWSGIFIDEVFNREAIIDVTGLSSEEITETLFEVNQEKMHHMQEQPLLNIKPSLIEFESFMMRLI
jgi:tRNA(His) 5'-end guanylyltransferase